MSFQSILLDVKSHVATITLNRPEAYNALTIPVARELFEAAVAADEDPEVRGIIVTGSGKAFCAGGDVKEFAGNLPGIGVLLKELTTYLHAAISRFTRTPKPVIMGVNGVAAGAGFSLAISGDLVVAAESARFTMAYAGIAATPDGSSTYFLPRLIGIRRALELFYLNRSLTAREALEWGLVNRVIPDAEFPETLGAMARQLAHGPTLAYGAGKQLFHHSLGESLEGQMELETQAIARSGKTEDFRSGVTAFAQKKAATFKGR